MDAATTDAAPGSSRLALVLAIAGAGLFLGGLSDSLARDGHERFVLALFFASLLLIFVPCAWRLTSTDATRRERVGVSLALGLGLLTSSLLRSPLIFDGFDELLHGANLLRMLDGRQLLFQNSSLPVSRYYPGLELVTVAVKWSTGLPTILAQTVVLLAARVVLVLCIFLVVERVCRSARAGGIGVLAFASNPHFYSFDAQYAYETLALALAAAAVYFVMASVDAQAVRSVDDPSSHTLSGAWRFVSRRPELALALGALAALSVTHHLTAWLTIAFLCVGALLLWTKGPRIQARTVGVAASAGVLLCGGWTVFVGAHLASYLGPILKSAAVGLAGVIGGLNSNRQLFQSVSGGPRAPMWEIALMLGAASLWCLVLLPALYAILRGRTIGMGLTRFVPVVVAAAYPLTLVASLSSASSQVAARASTFVFFGVAVVVGGWLAWVVVAISRPFWRIAIVVVASVCFLGSLLFGSGPDWSLVPGPYLVSADQRSVGAASIAAAEWASTHLPAGSHIAADRVNGVLLADLGNIEPSTAIGGLVNVTPLYVDPTVGRYETSLIRKADIRYILVDQRLTTGLPLFGDYFEPNGSRLTRLTASQIDKFASVPGVRRIYDNGSIQIYDVSVLLRGIAPRSSTGNWRNTSGPDYPVLAAFVLVGTFALAQLRRRRGKWSVSELEVVRWVTGAMLAGLVLATCLVASHIAPTVIGLVIAAMAAVGLVLRSQKERSYDRAAARSPGHAPSDVRARRRRIGAESGLAATGVLLLALGTILSIAAARAEWRPGAEIWLQPVSGQNAVVDVRLSASSFISRLEVVDQKGASMFTRSLVATTATQVVTLPVAASVGVARGTSNVFVVSGATTLSLWN